MSEKSKIISIHPGNEDPISGVLPDSTLIVTLTVGQLRTLVQEEMKKAQGKDGHGDEDSMLTVKEAASLLNVKDRWLYRHGNRLPFTRRLSGRNLRFSKTGLLRWRDAKRA